MSLQDKWDYLDDTKQQIKQAIIDKGVEVEAGATFRSYANKISQITSGGGTDTSDATAIPSDILENKTAYARGQKLVGTRKLNLYRVPTYNDLQTISNPKLDDYAIIDNSNYNETYINNIRTLLNNKYAQQFGPGIRQDNNIILYDTLSSEYFGVFASYSVTQADWNTNTWDVSMSSSEISRPLLLDPGRTWLNVNLLKYDKENNTLTNIYTNYAIDFPTMQISGTNYNWIIIYADKNVSNLIQYDYTLTYQGRDYEYGDVLYYAQTMFKPNLGTYRYNSREWEDISYPLTIDEYELNYKLTNNIVYGSEV